MKRTSCKLERFGDKKDGGYPICKNLITTSDALINIGIEARDNFGCAVTTYKKMPNYQYDCTKDYQPICNTNDNHNLYHKTCIGSKTETSDTHAFYTLEDMITLHDLDNRHIMLKIDC